RRQGQVGDRRHTVHRFGDDALMRLAPARVTGLALLSLFAVAACGKHYWGKSGASPEDFGRDSGECARENALYRGTTKEFGTVLKDQSKDGRGAGGWRGAKKLDPPPPGGSRGSEGDEPVRLTPPPSPPPPSTR